MGNLYKRIVTMGMISFTAILAFLYCILVYRTNATYIVASSLIVIGSIYAFLLALVDLKIKKEEETKNFAEEKIKELIQSQTNSDELETIQRLLKASYVQHRKTNTKLAELTEENKRLSQESIENDQVVIEKLQKQLTETINKAMKIMVKYNQNDNEKILSTTREMSAYITTMSADIDKLAKGLDNLTAEIKSIEFSPVINVTGAVANTVDTTVMDETSSSATAVEENTTPITEDDDDLEGFDAEAFLASFESSNYTDSEAVNNIVTSDETNTTKTAPIETANDDSNQLLSQDAIAALFAEVSPESKDDSASVETPTEEVKNEEVKEEDPNRQLTPDEIAAMFEASKEERRAKSDDDFKVHDHPEAMDQSLIDALLGNISEDESSLEVHDIEKETVEELTEENENLADVIPFPTKEINSDSVEETPTDESIAEEPVTVAPVSDDPNKQLSPDEIAALFAAASAPSTPKEEPVVEEAPAEEPVAEEPVNITPVSDDPNKQLSPDEIAALFAAASAPSTPKEEPVVEEAPAEEPVAEEPVNITPISDDPNKQLSPDEIAALFAAASAPSTPKEEPIVEEAPAEEPVAEEPVNITPISDDPNKQLSPDEIAALFASVQ